MAGAGSLTLHNTPTGWAAFRALRQIPAPLPCLVHGNWRHGMRSKAQREGLRHVRLAKRVMKMRARQFLALPPDVLDTWFPSCPQPVGWLAYRRHVGVQTE